METEAMGFKEAIKYGLAQYWQGHLALKHFNQDQRARDLDIPYDILVPNLLLAPELEISQEIIHASTAVQHMLARDKGLPYDEEIVAQADEENMAEESFLASRWSRLFPRLTDVEVITLKVR